MLTPTATTALSPRVPLTRMDNADPELLERLLCAVADVARAGQFTLGEELERFEEEFASYCDARHAIGVSSGTDALALSLRALGIQAGDEVIVPANSFIATAEAVSLIGAIPRFVDVDPFEHTVTKDTIAPAIGSRTAAVIVVHLYGRTVDLDPILDLTKPAGIAVVEDACQAHGAHYRGRRVGALADAGCFSFYPSKNLGGWGDGGAVVTNRSDLAERVRLLRSHGEAPRYRHNVVGTTARLDTIQAAILRAKLPLLDGWNDSRRRLAELLTKGLADVPVSQPAGPLPGSDHVYHQYVVTTRDRDALRAHLEERAVASAVHYPVPIHLSPAYRNERHPQLPIAERLATQICSLPMYPSMTGTEAEWIIESMRSFEWDSEGVEGGLD